MFTAVSDPQLDRLSRHLLLHGNAENKNFFSQKNCLVLMFIIDALVMIEIVKNGHFPPGFYSEAGDGERVERRKALYNLQLHHVFENVSLLKVDVLSEHL
jgi:hypothetical protein